LLVVFGEALALFFSEALPAASAVCFLLGARLNEVFLLAWALGAAAAFWAFALEVARFEGAAETGAGRRQSGTAVSRRARKRVTARASSSSGK
jgi:hypothetical protein